MKTKSSQKILVAQDAVNYKRKKMVSELTVTIKDEEKTLRTKYLLYDDYMVSDTDPIIKDCIDKTLENFDGEPSDIIVSIKMEIQ